MVCSVFALNNLFDFGGDFKWWVKWPFHLETNGFRKFTHALPVEGQILSERAAEQEDFDAEKFEETLKELT